MEVFMKQFINDMIHMTEGERLINYWYVWLGLIIVIAIVVLLLNKK